MDQGFRFGFANDQDDDEDDDADLISTEKTENARVSEAAHLNASDGVKIPKLYTLHEMVRFTGSAQSSRIACSSLR